MRSRRRSFERLRCVVVSGLFFTLAVAIEARADPIHIDFTSGAFFQNNIGNIGFPGDFDKLTLSSISDNFMLEPGASVVRLLNRFRFEVGITGLPVPNPVPLSLPRTLTVGGQTRRMTQGAEVLIGSFFVGDSLTIFEGSPVVFAFGDHNVRVTPLAVDTFTQRLGAVEGVIVGRFEVTPVPEPGSLFMLAASSLAVAARLRARRKRPTASA